MNRLFRTSIPFVVALLVALSHSFVAAQTPMEKLRVAYTVIAPTQLNVWTADRKSVV